MSDPNSAPTASFRKCNSCKSEIGWSTRYYVCNVSTCNRKRTGLVFCSVSCWDAHVPGARHRESWSEERRSPKSHTAMIEEEAAAASEHEKNLERAKREREQADVKAKADQAALEAARAAAPKFVKRRGSFDG